MAVEVFELPQVTDRGSELNAQGAVQSASILHREDAGYDQQQIRTLLASGFRLRVKAMEIEKQSADLYRLTVYAYLTGNDADLYCFKDQGSRHEIFFWSDAVLDRCVAYDRVEARSYDEGQRHLQHYMISGQQGLAYRFKEID